MANPICLSPLKFYDDINKQNHHKNYAFGHISPLIMPFNTLLPFQFVIPKDFNIEETILKSIDGKQSIDIQDFLEESGFCNKEIEENNVVLFPGKLPIPNIDYEGEYYLEMKTNVVEEEVKTEKQILYWGIFNQDIGSIHAQRVCLNLQGFAKSSIIPSLKIKVEVEDGKEFDISYPEETNSGEYSLYMAEYPYSAGIFYRDPSPIPHPDDPDGSSIQHGRVVNVKITDEEYKNIVEVIKIEDWSNYDLIDAEGLYNGFYLNVNVPEKQYNTKIIEHGPITYYSEIFCFTNSLQECLEIEYWNRTGNFYVKNGIVSFDDNFHFKLFLKSEIGKPEYNFEEESTKRFGYNFIESQVSKKVYKFNTVIPEFICDAMRIIRLCDNKIIKSKGEEYEAITFEMEAEWQTQGDLASVTCEFETDNVITNLGGFVPDNRPGDYNNDYNDDFKIS